MKFKFNDENNVVTKTKSSLKFVIFALSCIAAFGTRYISNIHSVIRDYLEISSVPIFQQNLYEFLTTLYFVLNSVMPLIGGYAIFKFGYRITSICVGGIIILGHLFFSLGYCLKANSLLISGKIFVSFSIEVFLISKCLLLIHWFSVRNISLVLGFWLSIGKLGDFASTILSNYIRKNYDTPSATWIGFACFAFAYISTILLCYLDWRQDLLIQMKEIVTSNESLTNRDDLREIKEVASLSKIFYLLLALVFALFTSIYSVSSVELFQGKWPSMSKNVFWHNNALNILHTIVILAVPFFGWIADNVGNKIYGLVLYSGIGIVLYISSFVIDQRIILVLVAVNTSLCLSLAWPIIILVTSIDLRGIALGFAVSIKYFCFLIMPSLIKLISNYPLHQYNAILFFTFFMIFSLVLSIFIYFEDMKSELSLNSVLDYVDVNEFSIGQIEQKLNKFYQEDEEKLISKNS